VTESWRQRILSVTFSQEAFVMEIGQTFIDASRSFLNTHLRSVQECLGRLNNEDVWWRPNQNSNSIGNLMLHMSGSLYQWIVTGIGGAPDHRVRQEEFDERSPIRKEELFARLSATVDEANRVLSDIDPEKLLEKIRVQNNESRMFAIYHVIEHFASHAGQIVLITKLRTNENLRLSD
jgi:uncharacterized damage-inducible protein DinB